MHEQHLFGIHGREDGAAASLRCIRAKDGEVVWEKTDVGMAHLIFADGKFLMQTVQGELIMFKASATAYEELGRIKLSSKSVRALPAISNGILYTKATDGELAAWSLP